MDAEILKKSCIKEKEKRRGIYQPFYGTWVVDFMLRQDAKKSTLGKHLRGKQIPTCSKILPKTSKPLFLYLKTSIFVS